MKRVVGNINRNEFAAKMRTAREKLGLKQSDIAKLIDVNPNSVSYYESGSSIPSLESALLIAQALNLSLDYMVGMSEEPNTDKKSIGSLAQSLMTILSLKGISVKRTPEGECSIIFDGSILDDFINEYEVTVRRAAKECSNGDGDENKEFSRFNFYMTAIVNNLKNLLIEEYLISKEDLLEKYNSTQKDI